MAGTPADLTIYIDTTYSHNHTYYGAGCKNPWDNGSITPCSATDGGGRITKTADNEEQKNGTYYSFQAATDDTGAAIKTDNSNAPDTFCPLGWQLPYSGTDGDYYNKSKSWIYLITAYSIGFNDGTTEGATKFKSYPFSYVYSGTIRWTTGRLYNQNNGGYYWSGTIKDDGRGYTNSTWAIAIRPNLVESKNYGYTVRCASELTT